MAGIVSSGIMSCLKVLRNSNQSSAAGTLRKVAVSRTAMKILVPVAANQLTLKIATSGMALGMTGGAFMTLRCRKGTWRGIVTVLRNRLMTGIPQSNTSKDR